MAKPRSFFSSLLIGNLLLIAVILGLGAWWTFNEVDRQANRNSRRFQSQLLALTKEGLEANWPRAAEYIEQSCRSYSDHPEFRLTVVDSEGNVLGDSDHAAEKMAAHNNENHPELLAALQGNDSESIRMSQTKKIYYRYAASPVMYDNAVVGALRIAVPVSDIAEERRRLFSGITTCFGLMLLAALFFVAISSWLWSKPFKAICRAARQIADGNLDPIPEVDGSSEMISLYAAVDTMRQTVSRQLETITWQRERLQSVLKHLPDAIFALDSEDRIVYYNGAAEHLFGLEPFSVAISVQHLLRFPEILDYYFSRLEGRSNALAREQTMLEIRQNGVRKMLELELVDIANRHHDEDIACLLITSDQTDVMQTERMKADFVANTSHELRTPLTSVRMTLDNALDGIYPASAHREVFEMLDRNIHRLEALTEDLLALHDVEEGITASNREKTTFLEQKAWLDETFTRKADEMRIAFHVVLADAAATVPTRSFLVDTKRLGLVLQNLIDNALKFTPEGGSVELRLAFSDDNTLFVQCEDTGCGIPPEEQNRVFERFYRVKQRKSEQRPGTGLGLSIVKHAVERLGGSISLSSQSGVGSTFTVRIPVTQETS